jgi:SagB-type dehydrogenase family enzyme
LQNVNQPISTAELFHEATKYTPLGIQLRASPPNIEDQPTLYKSYPDLKRIELGKDSRQNVQLEARAAEDFTTNEIGQLLYLTNGVTGILEYPGAEPFDEPEQIRLRAAPSAGGLYPTELYIALGAGHEVDPGVYNYNVANHELVQIQTQSLIPTLAESSDCPEFLASCSAVMVITFVYERSAWRYEDRAYRRVLLDTGHVLGNLVLAAERLGRQAFPMGTFCDDTLTTGLFLDRHYEGCLLLVPIVAPGKAPPTDYLHRIVPSNFTSSKSPNTSLMRHLHAASSHTKPFAAPVAFDVPDDDERLLPTHFGSNFKIGRVETDWNDELPETIIRRRSSRNLNGDAISIDDFSAMIYAGAESGPLLTQNLIETYFLVHNVEELIPGIYRFFPKQEEVRLIQAGDFKKESGQFCLGQELGSNASVVVIYTSHLPRAVTRFGNRAYRYLHLDAGHMGHRINLCAVKRSLGVSGIGGFFDDMINKQLGLPAEYATLYITCIGVPDQG